MNKSHLGTADNPQELVTAHDIGKLVDVVSIGKGFLRYVGPIHGKDGIFCGIELIEPKGKHDGSYQGVSYFIATPQHGIFAPIFRVSLESEEKKRSTNTTNRLSRSALPSLQFHSSFTNDPQIAPKDVMMTSVYGPSKPIEIRKPDSTDPMQMSMFSDMMDGSIFSNGSWSDIGESMITSNCTFTVRKGPIMSNDDDLMSVPMVQSVFNIDREALRREEQLQSSMVIGESRIGVEHLPIIEDENELETPLVELKTIGDDNANITPSTNTNPFIGEMENPPIEPPITNGNAFNNPPVSPPSPTPSYAPSHESDVSGGKKSGKSTVAPTKMEDKKVKTPIEPVAPKFPVKPKAPSKHQLMMEQLKASIEAEKNKPKKEIKSRVSLLPPPAPKVQKENKDAEIMETARRSIKQPLKQINKPAPSAERPKKERKPLYVAPPPKERAEKEKKTITRAVKTSEEKKTVLPGSVPSTSAGKKDFPTSSFAGGKGAVRKGSKVNSIKNSSINEEEKLHRLRNSSKAFEVLILVLQNLNSEKETNLKIVTEKYEKKIEEVQELKNLLEEARKKFEQDSEHSNIAHQQLIRKNANALEEMQKRHELEIAEKFKEYCRSLEEEKSRRDAEMCAMSNRHQKVVACLDEKIAEAEKQCEHLKSDKKTLQAALANDCDHRNQMLTKEISSLQTALDMKSAEMKELRQKNQNLSLQVDEIPLKELEISKWKHKANEYKQLIDQKINGEKILVQQIEDLRRKQIHDEEEKEAMRRSFDLMQFKIENGEEPSDSRFSTPSKVQFRARSSVSGTRPPSLNTSNFDHRLSTSSYGTENETMNRSTISMYMSQVRLPENHAEDVIYAPDEIISSRTGSISHRMSIAIESDPIIKSENEDSNQSDSGIGLNL